MTEPVQDLSPFSETDRRLVHALQIAPRAPWTLLATIVGADAVTLARRWRTLTTSGRSWLSSYPFTVSPGGSGSNHVSIAFVEVRCASDKAAAIATALRDHPQIVTIEYVTGERDLLLTVFTAGLASLSRLLTQDIARRSGVLSTSTQLTTRVVADGSRWQLRALDRAEVQTLRNATSIRSGHSGLPPSPSDLRRLTTALASDGRLAITEVSRKMSTGRPQARKLLDSSLTTGSLTIRCDVAQPSTPWPISVCLWTYVTPDRHSEIASALTSMPETRSSLGLTGGSANLLIILWLRTLEEVSSMEAHLAQRIPQLKVLNRSVALHQFKRMGWILDDNGCAVANVPVDPWYQ